MKEKPGGLETNPGGRRWKQPRIPIPAGRKQYSQWSGTTPRSQLGCWIAAFSQVIANGQEVEAQGNMRPCATGKGLEIPYHPWVYAVYLQKKTHKKTKNRAMWELRVKFYSGQNEDGGLGDSTSDRSERQLQRGGGKVRISVTLVKIEYTQSCAYFSRTFY